MIGWEGLWDAQRPPTTRWRRDAVIAGIIGVVIGGSIAYRVVQGAWPYSIGIGVIAFVLHVGIIALGQILPATRLSRPGLTRVGASSLASTFATAVLAWAIGT